MELTLRNLISFFEKEYPYELNFTAQTELRQSEANIDGIDAVDLLEKLAREFNVNFENFNFRQYFLDESELNTLSWESLFKQEKQREIETELITQVLFDYMINNVKSSK